MSELSKKAKSDRDKRMSVSFEKPKRPRTKRPNSRSVVLEDFNEADEHIMKVLL